MQDAMIELTVKLDPGRLSDGSEPVPTTAQIAIIPDIIYTYWKDVHFRVNDMTVQDVVHYGYVCVIDIHFHAKHFFHFIGTTAIWAT